MNVERQMYGNHLACACGWEGPSIHGLIEHQRLDHVRVTTGPVEIPPRVTAPVQGPQLVAWWGVCSCGGRIVTDGRFQWCERCATEHVRPLEPREATVLDVQEIGL